MRNNFNYLTGQIISAAHSLYLKKDLKEKANWV